MSLKTPVVLIIFKRPHTTEKVFEVIRQVQPSKLLVISDAARPDRPDEALKCEQTKAIIDRVDWDCEVIKNYAPSNLGCAKRVVTGLDWVFEQVEEAIILEDDCVPDLSFFPFCEALLEQYRFDTRIASIAAQNFAEDELSDTYSYYFSRYQHSWGWATWRRAWQSFSLDMSHWQRVKTEQILKDLLHDPRTVETWIKLFDSACTGAVDAWDYPWMLHCWLQHSLCIHPNVNLVTNVGFGSDATHTLNQEDAFANLPLGTVQFPLEHPPWVLRDVKADRAIQQQVYNMTDLQWTKLQLEKILGIEIKRFNWKNKLSQTKLNTIDEYPSGEPI